MSWKRRVKAYLQQRISGYLFLRRAKGKEKGTVCSERDGAAPPTECVQKTLKTKGGEEIRPNKRRGGRAPQGTPVARDTEITLQSGPRSKKGK